MKNLFTVDVQPEKQAIYSLQHQKRGVVVFFKTTTPRFYFPYFVAIKQQTKTLSRNCKDVKAIVNHVFTRIGIAAIDHEPSAPLGTFSACRFHF